MLKLIGKDTDVDLEKTKKPEFDAWRWDDFWSPIDQIIDFKRDVYEQALKELWEHMP